MPQNASNKPNQSPSLPDHEDATIRLNQALIRRATEAGNRLVSDEPLLVDDFLPPMPPPLPPGAK